jgi:hypothetical protein
VKEIAMETVVRDEDLGVIWKVELEGRKGMSAD